MIWDAIALIMMSPLCWNNVRCDAVIVIINLFILCRQWARNAEMLTIYIQLSLGIHLRKFYMIILGLRIQSINNRKRMHVYSVWRDWNIFFIKRMSWKLICMCDSVMHVIWFSFECVLIFFYLQLSYVGKSLLLLWSFFLFVYFPILVVTHVARNLHIIIKNVSCTKSLTSTSILKPITVF